VKRNKGTKEQRNKGTKEQRNKGTKEQRNKGTKEQRNPKMAKTSFQLIATLLFARSVLAGCLDDKPTVVCLVAATVVTF
jgi:flagellar biosynthesis/type III secretory pathway protein FliH